MGEQSRTEEAFGNAISSSETYELGRQWTLAEHRGSALVKRGSRVQIPEAALTQIATSQTLVAISFCMETSKTWRSVA